MKWEIFYHSRMKILLCEQVEGVPCKPPQAYSSLSMKRRACQKLNEIEGRLRLLSGNEKTEITLAP